jgi:hypothetical protein
MECWLRQNGENPQHTFLAWRVGSFPLVLWKKVDHALERAHYKKRDEGVYWECCLVLMEDLPWAGEANYPSKSIYV